MKIENPSAILELTRNHITEGSFFATWGGRTIIALKRIPHNKVVCEASGEILEDKKKSGEVRPWPAYRKDTELMAQAFKAGGYERHGERCADCGTRLRFAECESDNNHFRKLLGANFCKVRLCPMCISRRALKLAVQAHGITHEALGRKKGLRFIFLTLTVPNVVGDKLHESVTSIFGAWQRLMQRSEVSKVLLGSFRALEVTYNAERKDFHPHIHALLAVSSTYFTGDYITQSRWLELWRESARDQSIVSVDVRAVKPKSRLKENKNPIASAVSEVCKYPIKSADILHPTVLARDKNGQVIRGNDGKPLRRALPQPTVEQTAEVVVALHKALHGRRLVQFGGLLAEIHKELKMDNIDSSPDLVALGGEHEGSCPVCQAGLLEHVYKWVAGVGEYVG